MTLFLGLFVESVCAAFIVSITSRPLFFSLIAFDHASAGMLIPVMLGSTLGSFGNWLVGYGLARVTSPRLSKTPRFTAVTTRFRERGAFALLLVGLPFASLLTLFTGFCRIPPIKTLAFAAAGWMLFGCYHLYGKVLL